jgi:hypothetical protein
MKALTIWQPWAACICHGDKRVENRGWRPPDNIVGEVIAVHAGKMYDARGEQEIIRLGLEIPPRRYRTTYGAILGLATVKGVSRHLPDDPWFSGPFGWLLDDVRPLDHPVPCRGAQGLWTVPPEILESVLKGAN